MTKLLVELEITLKANQELLIRRERISNLIKSQNYVNPTDIKVLKSKLKVYSYKSKFYIWISNYTHRSFKLYRR